MAPFLKDKNNSNDEDLLLRIQRPERRTSFSSAERKVSSKSYIQ
jgi:hypothetical protein